MDFLEHSNIERPCHQLYLSFINKINPELQQSCDLSNPHLQRLLHKGTFVWTLSRTGYAGSISPLYAKEKKKNPKEGNTSVIPGMQSSILSLPGLVTETSLQTKGFPHLYI